METGKFDHERATAWRYCPLARTTAPPAPSDAQHQPMLVFTDGVPSYPNLA